jgi:hypothetical protein
VLKRFAAPFGASTLGAIAILLAPIAYWGALVLKVPQLREPHIDSAEARRRTVAFGEGLGLQVRDWSAAIHATLGAGHAGLARSEAWTKLPRERRNLAPITTIRVVLVAPDKVRWLAVWLRPDGAVHSYDTSSDLLRLGAIRPESESRAMAFDEARRTFPGNQWGEPELETAAAEGAHGARRYVWRTSILPGLESNLTVEVHCDRITERTVRLRVNEAELPVHETKANNVFAVTTSLLLVAGVMYAVYRFSRRALEREISWPRSAVIVGGLTLFGITIVLIDPNFGAAGLPPDRLVSPLALLILVAMVLSFSAQGIFAALIYGAGEGEMRESYPGKITSLDALFTGHLRARNIGRSLVLGAAAGGWAFLAVRLMYFIAGYSELRERSLSVPYGRGTWFILLANEPALAFFTVCLCLLLPLLYLSRHFGKTPLRRGLAILFCLLGTAASGYQIDFDKPATIGFAVVTAALVLLTFWYGDFLAAVIGLWWFFAFFENHAITEVVAAWTPYAKWTYALASASAIYGLVIAFRGREVSDAEVRPQHAHRLQERLQLEQEVSAAREAQIRLLPETLPEIPGVCVAASCHPAREVGGDFYDFFSLSRGRQGILVADGSSGGLASALTIGLAKGFLSYAAQRDWPPCQALARLAPVLTQAIASTQYHFSLCYAVLDPAAREIRIARLGRNPRLFHFNQRRRASGLGLTEEIHPPEDSQAEIRVPLSPGDLVMICTDGLATRLEAQLGCGIDEWLKRIDGESSKTAERFHEDLLRTVNATANDLHDDVTAVIIEMQVARLREHPGVALSGVA